MSDRVHEMHRDYFQREMRVGRRVIAEWNPGQRWPDFDPPIPESMKRQVVDGFEFRTEEDAATFNLDAMTGCPGIGEIESWAEAEAWVQEEPTPETRSVYQQFEEARAELMQFNQQLRKLLE